MQIGKMACHKLTVSFVIKKTKLTDCSKSPNMKYYFGQYNWNNDYTR